MTRNAKSQRRKDAENWKGKKMIAIHFLLFARLRLCAFAFLLLTLPIALAADPPAQKPKSLDDQLLDDLNDDLLQGLPMPARPAADPQPGAAPASDPEEAAGNPLAQIAERMRQVQQKIAASDTSDPTQALQRKIHDDLAALIEQAKKQCAACNKPGSGQGQLAGTGGNPAPAPPRESTNRIEPGTKETVETDSVQDFLRRFWGHLPDKVREQMQASMSEQYLPKYERLIEDYYKRLAEDTPARP
jgi:hypothetical protein